MFGVVLGIVAIVAAVFLFFAGRGAGKRADVLFADAERHDEYDQEGARRRATSVRWGSRAFKGGAVVSTIFALSLFAGTSYVFIGKDEVGLLNKIYGIKELPKGQIIAREGEKGPQARILGPGFHFVPLINVINEIEETAIVMVPEGYYGQIVALDGKPMPEGMFIAPRWSEEQHADMLDASYFLNEGGYKGPQASVLKPGKYRLNTKLFKVTVDESTRATIIKAGFVGVVKSNIDEHGGLCVEEEVSAADDSASRANADDALSVKLVQEGCVGIWKEALFPAAYYLNRKAYEVTEVDTRVQTWSYKGGYKKKFIDLTVDQQGNINQAPRHEEQLVPENAADRAVFVKIEGWDIPVELRALVQVSSETAPVVVGAVGGLGEVEDRILTPAIRSIVRNVAGSNIRVPIREEDGSLSDPVRYEVRKAQVLDLIDNRDAIEAAIEEEIKREGAKAGILVREIRIGEPAIPPELLVSRLRQQLADQLSAAYERETEAQSKRIKTEQARATADQQDELVKAEIAVKVANQREQERAALGRAERIYLEELAAGQKAQAGVLGEEKVAMLQALDKVLAGLKDKPELVTLISKLVPNTVVMGDSGGLSGPAAIISEALSGAAKTSAQPGIGQ